MCVQKPAKHQRPLVVLIDLHVAYGQFWHGVRVPIEESGMGFADYSMVRGRSFQGQFDELSAWITDFKETADVSVIVACPTFDSGELNALGFFADGDAAWAVFQKRMRLLAGVGCVQFAADFSGSDFHFLLLTVREPVAGLITKLKAAAACEEGILSNNLPTE